MKYLRIERVERIESEKQLWGIRYLEEIREKKGGKGQMIVGRFITKFQIVFNGTRTVNFRFNLNFFSIFFIKIRL